VQVIFQNVLKLFIFNPENTIKTDKHTL